ncbi:MAG: hypothetical protein WCJ97_11300 [Phycisphaerae bacterium]
MNIANEKLFVEIEGRLHVWSMQTIWDAAASCEPFEMSVQEALRKLDDNTWRTKDYEVTTWDVIGHTKRTINADLAYPIILSRDGYLVEGSHRIVKAYIHGLPTIQAVRLPKDPPPDEVLDKTPESYGNPRAPDLRSNPNKPSETTR